MSKKNEELNNQQTKNTNVEQNKYTLDLVNVWINSADQKIGAAFGIFSAIFAAFGFLVGSKLSDLKEFNTCLHCVLVIFSFLSIATFVVGLSFFFFALKPSLLSDFKKRKYSIFYEEIASFSDPNDYMEESLKASEEDFNKEICKEIYYNSKICSNKMHKFRIGLIISSIAILLAVLIVVVLLVVA